MTQMCCKFTPLIIITPLKQFGVAGNPEKMVGTFVALNVILKINKTKIAVPPTDDSPLC